jgi:hypothetical protein
MMKKERTTCKMVGVWLPLPIFTYLSYYCLLNRKGKSSILRPLIVKWYVKEKEKIGIEVLRAEMVIRIQTEWDTKKTYLSLEKEDFTTDYYNFLADKAIELLKTINEVEAAELLNKIKE